MISNLMVNIDKTLDNFKCFVALEDIVKFNYKKYYKDSKENIQWLCCLIDKDVVISPVYFYIFLNENNDIQIVYNKSYFFKNIDDLLKNENLKIKEIPSDIGLNGFANLITNLLIGHVSDILMIFYDNVKDYIKLIKNC